MKFKRILLSQVWWHVPVIPALWRLRQKNLDEFLKSEHNLFILSYLVIVYNT
jgi:hypothetical protein